MVGMLSQKGRFALMPTIADLQMMWNDSFGRGLLIIMVLFHLVLLVLVLRAKGTFACIARWWTRRRRLLESLVLKAVSEGVGADGRWIDEESIVARIKSSEGRPPWTLMFVSRIEIAFALDRLVDRGDLMRSQRCMPDELSLTRTYALVTY
jgi:hypothetical protein